MYYIFKLAADPSSLEGCECALWNRLSKSYTYMCIYIYVYVCVYIYIYIYIYVRVCIYVYMYVSLSVSLSLYIYIYIYIYRDILYIYIYIYQAASFARSGDSEQESTDSESPLWHHNGSPLWYHLRPSTASKARIPTALYGTSEHLRRRVGTPRPDPSYVCVCLECKCCVHGDRNWVNWT